MRRLNSVSAIFLVVTFLASAPAQAVEPLPNGHAHNDYLHGRPLFDALSRGFTSVEVDVFLVDGKLLVAHDRDSLTPDKTLESLYLSPLARRVTENDGTVYRHGQRFLLLIDIKSDAQSTYARLEKALAKHADMFTTVDGGKVREAAVTAIVTGDIPRDAVVNSNPRYVGFDGRITDLNSDLPAHLMPLISDKWTDHFKWSGDGPMPAAERHKLQEVVKKAHAAGRLMRFWATPEDERVWSVFRVAGVDLINTDQLDRLSTFLRSSTSER